MVKRIITIVVCLLDFGLLFLQAGPDIQGAPVTSFAELMEVDWKEVFYDPCTQEWENNWTLDGLKATVSNSTRGMDFIAGPKAFDDAHHAVLWTKQDFKGDLKIEYEYTRLDNEDRMVTIIYIQATGSGQSGFGKDISTWAEKRTVPSMETYFNNMHAYHISYAAYGMNNRVPVQDHIRGRRYMCKELKGTKLENEYKNTGLFEPGIPHKITIIKRERDIYMHIQSDRKKLLCHFINARFPPIKEGKIGLRHMYTRGARYKDFKVSVVSEDWPELKVSQKPAPTAVLSVAN